MKLYYFPGACSLADHIVLDWIGAPYETVRMTHATARSPEYLALNPNGTVLLLMDGAFVLTQNVAILTYLAAYAKPIADTARAHVRVHLGRIDAQLDGRDWLTGERTVADPYLFVMFRWAVRLDIGIDGLARLSRFAERMYADPGVRRVILAEEDVIELAA